MYLEELICADNVKYAKKSIANMMICLRVERMTSKDHFVVEIIEWQSIFVW